MDLAVANEAFDATLAFWVGKCVTRGAIMGLESRGWVHEIGDEDMVYQFNKHFSQMGKTW